MEIPHASAATSATKPKQEISRPKPVDPEDPSRPTAKSTSHHPITYTTTRPKLETARPKLEPARPKLEPARPKPETTRPKPEDPS